MELTYTFINGVVNLQPDHPLQGNCRLNVQEINQILLRLNITVLLTDYLVFKLSISFIK